ncbi:MAG: VCBS repeat-containing protein [Acidobacteria bacterium]|nr:VCBS repeat-containing protein [Acidobacteriota bacterium]
MLATLLFSNISDRTSAAVEEPAFAPQTVRFGENFDGVTAPQLPAGWTVSTTGGGGAFTTVTTASDTAPNAVFAPNSLTAGLSELTSPPMVVTGANAVLNFRHQYSLENTWDGGVLEVKIGSGQFQDALLAGCVFLSNGYTRTINPSTNPLAGRSAWTGGSEGFVLTSVQLPASTFGQTVQFRWRLGTNDGFSALGWWIDTITLETIPTAANAAAIAIPTAGTAAPYPSSIQVSGLPGLVTGLAVNIENFSHNFPDDVDILLVAPNGRRIVLMSDAGGGTAANNLSLTFSDTAPSFLPDNGPLAAGIFKPTNYDDTDTFPAPAPQGAVSGTTLGAFYGTNPNGTWSLYVVDDNGSNAGAIAGGWSLDIQSSVSACLFTLSPTAQAFPVAGGSGGFQINIPAGCGWTASTTNSFITIDSPASGINSAAVSLTVAPNTGGARTGLVTVSDGINQRTFQAQQGSGCPTSLAQTNLNYAAAGGGGNVPVTAGAGCSWQAVSNAAWVVVTSAQQTGSGALLFNVLPNPSRSARSTSVTVGARTLNVNQAGATAARFDFDGDGRADISVFRNGTWYLQQSASGFAAAQFGISTDVLTPADFDGDGKTDIAVYRNGVWYVLQSSNAQFFAFQFGLAADVPVPADYDGDGRAELAVFRGGTWYLFNLANNQTSVLQFGLAGDKPVVGDYDGDGKADLALYRGGTWYLQRSALGFGAVQFGLATDRPVGGDFDGDGKADLAVYRGAGEWHILANFQNYSITQFGLATDTPVPADYDGDGKTDVAVFRSGVWYILQSTNAQPFAYQFGLAGDRPVPGN